MKALAKYQAKAIERDLEEIRERFERWRDNRKRGARIPAELWQAAVSLFPRYSVNRISRAFGLDYEGVRNRIENERGAGSKGFRFWELRLSELQAHAADRQRIHSSGERGTHCTDSKTLYASECNESSLRN